MNKLFFIFLSFAFCISCTREGGKNGEILSFDVTKKYPEKTMDIHEIADVEYVVLESRDSALFSNCVYLTDKYVIAFNYYEWDYVFFDRTGKFVSRLNRGGQGPEEYMPFWMQVYDEKEDDFFVFSYPNKIQVYDRNGNYKRTLRLKHEENKESTVDGIFDYGKFLLCHDKLSATVPFYLIDKQDGTIRNIPIFSPNKIETRRRETKPSGEVRSLQADLSYAIRSGDGILLTDYSNDTIFKMNPTGALQPVFIRKPSIHTMNPPVVVNGFIETDAYSFFSTQRLDFDFNNTDQVRDKGYLLDKKANRFYELKVSNRDYEGQDLIVSPAELTTRVNTEYSINPRVGLRALKTDQLLQANQNGKLSGPLKHIVDSMEEDNPFVVMIMRFR